MRLALQGFWLTLLLVGGANMAVAKPLPSTLTSAIILKLMSMESGLQADPSLSILVINDPALADQLEKRLGKPVGNSQLGAVYRDKLPAGVAPSLVYINSQSQFDSLLKTANRLGAISVSPDPAHATRGAVMVIYDDQGLPSITINMAPSRALNLQWHPSVLEISDVIY